LAVFFPTVFFLAILDFLEILDFLTDLDFLRLDFLAATPRLTALSVACWTPGVLFSNFFEPAPSPSATRVRTTPAAAEAAAPSASAATERTDSTPSLAIFVVAVFASFATIKSPLMSYLRHSAEPN
jgi:hypothetical protein